MKTILLIPLLFSAQIALSAPTPKAPPLPIPPKVEVYNTTKLAAMVRGMNTNVAAPKVNLVAPAAEVSGTNNAMSCPCFVFNGLFYAQAHQYSNAALTVEKQVPITGGFRFPIRKIACSGQDIEWTVSCPVSEANADLIGRNEVCPVSGFAPAGVAQELKVGATVDVGEHGKLTEYVDPNDPNNPYKLWRKVK